MKNLKQETIKILNEHGKTESDVLWIGTEWATIPINTFWEVADREYHDGYGGAEVNTCLKVVGNDWWLERGVYDGSEWWEFKTMPPRPLTGAEEEPLKFVFEPYYL